MIKAVFFDLDGTLLPFDENQFIKYYFSLLFEKVKHLGFEKNKFFFDLMQGTKLMYQNDGRKTNEEVFWTYFDQENQNISYDKAIFDEFYQNEFQQTKIICELTSLSKDIITFCHQNFPCVILATNPIFPLVATKTRMGFVSLQENDFNFITSYENFSYCKPNKDYFMALLNKFDLKPDEVIMFGNNVLEDGYACYQAGIKCYLVGNYIIENDKINIPFPRIGLDQIIDKIKEEINY